MSNVVIAQKGQGVGNGVAELVQGRSPCSNVKLVAVVRRVARVAIVHQIVEVSRPVRIL